MVAVAIVGVVVIAAAVVVGTGLRFMADGCWQVADSYRLFSGHRRDPI